MIKIRLRIFLLFTVMLGVLPVLHSAAAIPNSITSPDTTGDVGLYTSLVLDASGNPVVSYYANGRLRLLHCNDVNCAGNDDSITTPDRTGHVGYYTSLVLDASGFPVVSYFDLTNSDLKLLHCNDFNCAGNDDSITNPDTTGDVGHFTSLALDVSGNPVVSYYDQTNGDLKLLHCNDVNCAGNDDSITSPDTTGTVGYSTSLALDASGNPVVSYYDLTNGDLKLLHCNDVNCAGNDDSITSPDTTGTVGYATSLALDASGFPVVSYNDLTNGNLKLLHCNDVNCDGVGDSMTTLDPSVRMEHFTSLALDVSGNPVVSYYDRTNTTLKLLHCKDVNCAGNDNSITSPDRTGNVGYYIALVLDASGFPVVSYLDLINEDLKLLHCATRECRPEFIAPTVTLNSVLPAVTNSSPISVTVTFDEAVTGFTASDLILTNGTVRNFTSSDAVYTFDLVPSNQGVVTVDIPAGVAQDLAGNANTAAVQFSRHYDSIAPTVTLSSGLPEATNSSPIPVTVTFSEAVTGFTASDLTLTNGIVSNFTGSDAVYTFDLVPSEQGVVIVDIPGGAAQDLAGNANVATLQLFHYYDSIAPTATINQAAGQADPTNHNTITFQVIFNELVTGFAAADVRLSGSVSGTVVTSVTGRGHSYNVGVSVPTTAVVRNRLAISGTVIINIGANAAVDAVGNGNTAAITTDNRVIFDKVPPTVAMDSIATNPTNSSPIPVTVTFDEAVTGFTASDLTLTNGTVRDFVGSGVVYTFALVPDGDGLVTVALTAGMVQDLAGNDNGESPLLFSRTYIAPIGEQPVPETQRSHLFLPLITR